MPWRRVVADDMEEDRRNETAAEVDESRSVAAEGRLQTGKRDCERVDSQRAVESEREAKRTVVAGHRHQDDRRCARKLMGAEERSNDPAAASPFAVVAAAPAHSSLTSCSPRSCSRSSLPDFDSSAANVPIHLTEDLVAAAAGLAAAEPFASRPAGSRRTVEVAPRSAEVPVRLESDSVGVARWKGG